MAGRPGGFASHVRVDNWQFAHSIPDSIASEFAGPLLCAGTTVFTPLLRYGVLPTDRVAVVGIGGLGHLAVQFLAKWGGDVTAITSTHNKDEAVLRFGARRVVATHRSEELAAVARSFDFVLSTVSADLPWDTFMATLRPGGKLCVVGIAPTSIAVSPWSLIAGEKSLVGGQPGSIEETRHMLQFAALHDIRPVIETFAMPDADAALEHTRRGLARFCSVLVA